MKIVRHQLIIKGNVISVGFRAYFFRLAEEQGIVGFVANKPPDVVAEIEGGVDSINQFQEILKNKPPIWAKINFIEIKVIPTKNDKKFIIRY